MAFSVFAEEITPGYEMGSKAQPRVSFFLSAFYPERKGALKQVFFLFARSFETALWVGGHSFLTVPSPPLGTHLSPQITPGPIPVIASWLIGKSLLQTPAREAPIWTL